MKYIITLLLTCILWIPGSATPRNYTLPDSTNIPTVQEFFPISSTKYSKGLFNIYEKEHRYYIEIPDQLINRDLVSILTIVKNSAREERSPRQLYGYPGDALWNYLFHFEHHNGKQISLVSSQEKRIVFNPQNKIYKLLDSTKTPQVISILPIKARGKHSAVVDFTEILLGDNSLFSLNETKGQIGVGTYEANKSEVSYFQSFKENINFRVIKSFVPTPVPDKKRKNSSPNYSLRLEIGVSILLLPEHPMLPRINDPRVGFFANPSSTYDMHPLLNTPINIVSRWRLEPKPEDIKKYQKGELVEPAKPIVFYLDYNIPEYLMPHLFASIQAWEVAFHRAGFKNAIIGKRMPKPDENPDFSIEDARYSIISYKASPVQNAYGPHLCDPRTGEILCSHVGLFHNVQKVVQRWYFSQTAAINPQIRQFPWPDSIIGKLVRYVITHEIGHTLGLPHNFIGSHVNTVSQIRDREYVHKHGHTSSVMDYARFNYVAQPEDNIDIDDLIPDVGEYDKFSIEWGYRYFPRLQDIRKEQEYLKKWVSEQQKNPYHLFGSENNTLDPRCQMEDLGDNNMEAGELGILNLKRIMEHLEEWTAGDDEDYTILKEMYYGVRYQYMMYIQHILPNIGGNIYNDFSRSSRQASTIPIGRQQQKEAMAFLEKYFFKYPDWLFNDHLKSIAKVEGINTMERLYSMNLEKMLKSTGTLFNQEIQNIPDRYPIQEYLDDLFQIIFTELTNPKPVSHDRQCLQRIYITKVHELLSSIFSQEPALTVLLNMQLEKIEQQAAMTATQSQDFKTKAHWESISNTIRNWLPANTEL